MTVRLAAPLSKDSIVDGDGLRAVLWTQGCLLKCPGCHNAHTHDLHASTVVSAELIKFELRQMRMQRGITFSGGEPFLQAAACADIARFAKQTLGWDVWCYSGYTFDVLCRNEKNHAFLNLIDVLVDGPFIRAEHDPLLKFRGSRNQRILRLREPEKLPAEVAAFFRQ